MAAFHDEGLRIEILKRLPIKTLHRFQCVCTSWRSLVSSSFFIMKHFSFNSCNDDDDDGRAYIAFDPISGCFMPSFEDVESYAFFEPPCLVENLEFSHLPFPSGGGSFDVIHGVVCLSCPSGAILWNPTIRKHVEILRPTPESRVIGFGFHAGANGYEFKVVSMTTKTASAPTFDVFSTRDGRWRSISVPDAVEDDLGNTTSPLVSYGSCFSNGFIHWVVQRDDLTWEILMLGCESEEFKIMELPREFIERHPVPDVTPWHLVRYCGSLASLVWQKSRESIDLDPWEEWIMEEHGVPSSWKKLSTKEREGFVSIEDGVRTRKGLVRQKDEEETFDWKPIRSIKRSHRVMNSYVFEPSMFLTDVRGYVTSV